MKAVSRRIARLEERFAPPTQDPVKKILRAVISNVAGGIPDLAKCTAKRTLCPDGTLLEVVHLDGSAEGLDQEKLQEWLLTKPILTLEAAKREHRRAAENLGDSIFRDPARRPPAQDPQPFHKPRLEPLRPALAPVETPPIEPATPKPTTWPSEERRNPIDEEMRRRENRRGPTLPPIVLRSPGYD